MDLRRIPKPQSDAELEIVSRLYFGVPLHLDKLTLDSFEVAEDFDSYNRVGSIGAYAKSNTFWTWALGQTHCGGTARASYGQFRCGHRARRRLERWVCSRRAGDSSSVRPALAKVSRALDGPGGNTPIRADRGVLRGGRVDGASSSFAEEGCPYCGRPDAGLLCDDDHCREAA